MLHRDRGPIAPLPWYRLLAFRLKMWIYVFHVQGRNNALTQVLFSRQHDMFTSGANHMCMVHNSILRGYNSIYHQAAHVSEADKSDFIGYCLTWHKFLQSHAENEEKSLFPKTEELLEDQTIWEESHKEHDAFTSGTIKFHDYLAGLKGPTDFSGATLLEIMDIFQEPLGEHLRAEVSTIAILVKHPRTPKVGSAKEEATMATFDSRERYNLIKSGMTDVLPFFLSNFDCSYEDGMWANWPPIPRPVRWTILRVAQLLHPGWWKFSTCDSAGQRKTLYALEATRE